jgi:hypothetical protein
MTKIRLCKFGGTSISKKTRQDTLSGLYLSITIHVIKSPIQLERHNLYFLRFWKINGCKCVPSEQKVVKKYMFFGHAESHWRKFFLIYIWIWIGNGGKDPKNLFTFRPSLPSNFHVSESLTLSVANKRVFKLSCLYFAVQVYIKKILILKL